MFRKSKHKQQIELLRPKLYRLAWAWCHDSDLADDLTQTALTKALSKIDQLRDDKRLEAWLCQILSNQFRDYLRARKDEVSPEWEAMESPMGSPEDETSSHELVNRVRQAVAMLKPDFRMVITMVDLMGLSYAEVSQALDIPMGTVMSRVSRGRSQLKKSLDDLQPRSRREKVVSLRRGA
ncbi:MAG: RNA polymerase sigma factor [Gammaproteobacteria bacterium]